MTRFAAYDADSIYAIGATREQAIAIAREDARDPTANFQTAPIRDGLANAIEEGGWNPHLETFDIGPDGFIRDTTKD